MAAAVSLNARQWRITLAVFAAVVAALSLAYYWFLAGEYAVLARGLRAEEAAAIVEQLEKESVPFELRDGGNTILVPASQVDAVRLDVSSGDVPLRGAVGFELFNESDMGLTDFAQKVNFQRALQGEIARTIMAMDGIAYARVHMALPERSVFRIARSEPRAAVTLIPQQGVQIDPERIAGIQRLVAATVPDLALDQIAILNERGQLLTPEFSDLPGAAASTTALESNYGERVSRVLAEVVPRAHVKVKVTVLPHNGTLAAGGSYSAPSGGSRDHSIRLVLFEATALSIAEEKAVRRAVTRDLGLDPANGDELAFSPLPQIAADMPAQASAPSASGNERIERPQVQDRFLAELTRRWTAALSLLGALALLFMMFSVRRGREGRRQTLATRIREQLLLPHGAPDAA